MRSVTMFLIMLFVTSISVSATIYVPDDYPTIQEAIDASVNGDIIIVRPGNYMECINFKGKSIRVTGEKGPDSTIIDAAHSGTVVTFESGEGLDSILEKLSLIGGIGYCGGGIRCVNASSPTIRNNIIRNNHAADTSGGIFCVGSSPAIINNIIASNDADQGEMSGMKPPSFAGGIGCWDHSSPTLINNTIHGNKAADGCDENGDPMYGGGGGILCDAYSSPTITNTILWGNIASKGAEAMVGNASSLTIDFSDVNGGQSSVYVDGGTLNWGSGMINADPLFVDAAINDFHLIFNSPCRGSGDNSVVTELCDFEGDPRIYQGTVDMGADEFYTHLYITGDQTPGGEIQGKLVGLPGTSPVRLFIGLGGVRPTPLPTLYGDLWLLPPRLSIPLVPIPANGILAISTMIPPTPPAPYNIPMQALIGLNSDSLTNLCLMNIE